MNQIINPIWNGLDDIKFPFFDISLKQALMIPIVITVSLSILRNAFGTGNGDSVRGGNNRHIRISKERQDDEI